MSNSPLGLGKKKLRILASVKSQALTLVPVVSLTMEAPPFTFTGILTKTPRYGHEESSQSCHRPHVCVVTFHILCSVYKRIAQLQNKVKTNHCIPTHSACRKDNKLRIQ
jgi:hypothetical protein